MTGQDVKKGVEILPDFNLCINFCSWFWACGFPSGNSVYKLPFLLALSSDFCCLGHFFILYILALRCYQFYYRTGFGPFF